MAAAAADVKAGTIPPAAASTAAVPSAAAAAAGAGVPPSPPKACAACGVAGATKRCGGCKVAHYCSAECQQKHWPLHKPQCELGTVSAGASAAAAAGDSASQAFAAERARHTAQLQAVMQSYTTAIDALKALAPPAAADAKAAGAAGAAGAGAGAGSGMTLPAADRAILSRLHVERARTAMALGPESDAAVTEGLNTALALDEKNITAYVLSGEMALRQSNGDLAMKRANQGLALAPADGAERAALQQVLFKAQDVVYKKQLKQSGSGAYTRQSGCPTYNFAVVVVRNPKSGKYLAVNESRNRGWWLPAGFVDPGEDFVQAAHRETLEEAGLKVVLKGVLRVEHSVKGAYSARMRVVFYAEPEDPNAPPKSVADEESECAQWKTHAELKQLRLRGDELVVWSKYLDAGGCVYPLSVLTDEGDATPQPKHTGAKPVVGAAAGKDSSCASM